MKEAKEPVIKWDQQQLDRIETLAQQLYADTVVINGPVFSAYNQTYDISVHKTHDAVEMLDIYVLIVIEWDEYVVETRSYLNFEKALSEFSKEVRKWHK